MNTYTLYVGQDISAATALNQTSTPGSLDSRAIFYNPLKYATS